MYKLPAQHGKLRIATLSLVTLAEGKPRKTRGFSHLLDCGLAFLLTSLDKWGAPWKQNLISLKDKKKRLGIGPLRLLNAFSGLIILTVLRFRLWTSFWIRVLSV